MATPPRGRPSDSNRSAGSSTPSDSERNESSAFDPQPSAAEELGHLNPPSSRPERRDSKPRLADEPRKPSVPHADPAEPVAVAAIEQRNVATVWGFRLIWLVLLMCLFAHLFVLGLTGERSYTANIEEAEGQLVYGANIVSELLAEIYAAAPNGTVADAFAMCVAFIDEFNSEVLVDGHELLLAVQTSKTTPITYRYVTALKFLPDCIGTCALTPFDAVVAGLVGQSGSMLGPDYSGTTVLAAYTYVEGFNVALVWKTAEPPLRSLITNELIDAVAVCLSFIFVSLVGLGCVLHWLLRQHMSVSCENSPSKDALFVSRMAPPMVVHHWPVAAMMTTITVEIVVVSVLVGVTTLCFTAGVYQQTTQYAALLNGDLLGGLLQLQATESPGVSPVTVVNTLNRVMSTWTESGLEAVLAQNATAPANHTVTYLTGLMFADQCAAAGCGTGLDGAMQLALTGRRGAEITPDYRPVEVLAAYVPLPALGMGLVLKQDTSAVNQDFRSLSGLAAGICSAIAIATITAACLTVLFITIHLWHLREPFDPPAPVRRARWILQVTVFTIYAVTAIVCTCILLGLHSNNFRNHTLLHLQVGASIAAASLENTANDTATYQFIATLNALQLPGAMELEVDAPGSVPVVPRKYQYWCTDPGCSPQKDTAMIDALAGGVGSLVCTDYRPVFVSAGYAPAPTSNVGVVFKEDWAAAEGRFDSVIREVAIGLIAWLIAGGLAIAAMGWWAIDQEFKASRGGGCGPPFLRPCLSTCAMVAVVVLFDMTLLIFGYFQPFAEAIVDQSPMLLHNLRLTRGLLNVTATDNTSLPAMGAVEFVNHLNYQVLPLWMEAELVAMGPSAETFQPLADPKFRADCPLRNCPVTAGVYGGVNIALTTNATGTLTGPSYDGRTVLEAYGPLPALGAAIALTADLHWLHVQADQYLVDQIVSCVAISLVSLVGIGFVTFLNLRHVEHRVGIHPPRIPRLPDPLLLSVVVQAFGIIVLLFLLIVCVLWASLGQGYTFMLQQTARDLDVGVQVAVGLMAQQMPNPSALLALLNEFNYQVLPGSYEMLAASPGSGYLTELKLKSECPDNQCMATSQCLGDAPNGTASPPMATSEDYRGWEVVSAAAPVPAGVLASTLSGLALKVDHAELMLKWNAQALWASALFSFLLWLVAVALTLLGMWWVLRLIRRDMASAWLAAQHINNRRWDHLEDVLRSHRRPSAYLLALESVAQKARVWSAYAPPELFAEGSVTIRSPKQDAPDVRVDVEMAATVEAPKSTSLRINRVSPLPDDPATSPTAAPAPEAGVAVASPPRGLQPVTALCFEVFNLDALRRQLGVEVVCKIHSDLTDRLLQTMKGHQGLVHPWLWPLPKCFVTWNAARPATTVPERTAARAALALQQALQDLNTTLQAEHNVRLQVGIAVSTGPVASGPWGSHAAPQFGLMGDGLTLLASLVGLNRALRSSILLDEPTRGALEEGFLSRLVDIVDHSHSHLAGALPGFQTVYELLGETGGPRPAWFPSASENVLDEYHAAMRHAVNGEVASAIQCLQAHVRQVPGDAVATAKLDLWRHQLRDLTKKPCAPRQHRDEWETPA